MNFAFELQKDKDLREDDPFQTYKIVSLLKVLDFAAARYVWLTKTLLSLSQDFRKLVEKGQGEERPDAPGEKFEKTMTAVYADLLALGLNMSALSAQRFLDSALSQKTINEILAIADDLNTRIEDELNARHALLFPAERTKYYKTEGTFLGENLISGFSEPGFVRDATEAGNCYALGRYTACVFHLSRLLEGSVQKLATDLEATKNGQPLDVKNEEWFQIEISISKVINPWPKGEKRTKYLKVLSSLSAIRGGWRNPTMHPGDWYSDEEAEMLLKFTKQFLVDFAELPPP